MIMATAKGTEFDKIENLDLGADDYLVKPFGMMEMVSRVKAVIRRCTPKDKSDIISFGGLSLNPAEHILTSENTEIQLTYKEFELLKILMSSIGKVMTREKLFAEVWGEDYMGESRTLDVHIRTLRQKIGRYGDFIKTVRNVGYRMEAYHD